MRESEAKRARSERAGAQASAPHHSAHDALPNADRPPIHTRGVALKHLAYEEAKRKTDRQSVSLDGLRDRAGILLAALSLATSFFGGLSLQDGNLATRVIVAASVATALGVLAGAFCVGVLWPRAEWRFNWRARQLLPKLDASADEAAPLRLHLGAR
jgi:hypothetical protein